MNWSKSLSAAAISAGATVFAAAPALALDGGLSYSDSISLLITFGAVFFAYLKSHLPEEPKE